MNAAMSFGVKKIPKFLFCLAVYWVSIIAARSYIVAAVFLCFVAEMSTSLINDVNSAEEEISMDFDTIYCLHSMFWAMNDFFLLMT